jgi:hypothetical protein
MKKTLLIFLLLLLSYTGSQGQAFKDISEIKKLKTEKPEDLEKIVTTIIPYFTDSGVIQKERIKKYLLGGLGDKIVKWLNVKATKLSDIEEFLRTRGDSPLKKDFNLINKDLDSLNVIRTRYDSIITGLPTKFDLENVVKDYSGNPLIMNLERILVLEKTPLKEDSTVILLELANLKAKTHIKTGEAQQILENISKMDSLFNTIRTKRINILAILENSPTLITAYLSQNKGSLTVTPADINNNLKSSKNLAILPLDRSITQIATQQVFAMSSFKLPTQSDMIDALVIFIAKRFSQEIAITFLESLKQRAKTMQLVSDLFPATIKLLSEGNSYEVPRMGSIWHYAIAQDINNIPFHLNNSEYIKDKISKSKFSGYYPLFQDLVTVAELVKSGNALPDILTMYNSGLYTLKDKNMIHAFEAMKMINNEFAGVDSDYYWLKWDHLSKLSNEDWDLMIKMIASKYKTVLFDSLVFSVSDSNFGDEKWKQIRKTIQQSLVVLNQFEERRIALQKNTSPNVSIKLISFWECQQQLFSVLLDENIISDKKTSNALSFMNRGLLIYKLQEDGNHTAMIRESLALVQDLFPKEVGRVNELFVKSWRMNKDRYLPVYRQLNTYLAGIDQLFLELSNDSLKVEAKVKFLNDFGTKHFLCITETSFEKIKTQVSQQIMDKMLDIKGARSLLAVKTDEAVNNLLNKANANQLKNLLYVEGKATNNLTGVLKTAEFFMDVMSASNNNQLADVIKAYASPPNSYKIRRNSRFSIDFDAHIGIYGGAELLSETQLIDRNVKQLAFVWGLSAPIGLSMSWGKRRETLPGEAASFINRKGLARTLKKNSYSLGISLIDIAAPLAFRVSNDEEEALPKSLAWSQLFSPGLHLRVGIKNTPFAISGGAQYTPQLRKTSLDVTDQQAYRGYIGLFYDMPLFNLYRRM